MRTAMSGAAWVAYGQIYVESSGRQPELPESFGGQQNGLCGAAVQGALFLMTGLHTGRVGFVVEVYDEAPAIDEFWEEIVEASFRPVGAVALNGWGGEGHWPLDLDEVDYRVRYCGWGMDAGHQAAPPMDDEPLVDRYLVQFWPAPPAPDRVVKQTSAQAAYWHRVARETPPPPTAEQRAELKRERERRAAEEALAELTREWGGTLPSERVRDASLRAFGLAQLDRPLIDDIDRVDPDTQRAIARWAVRRVCVDKQLDQQEWIAAILDGIDHGVPVWSLLPAPAAASPTDNQQVRLAFRPWGWNDDVDPIENLWTLLFAADDDDPLRAAFETVWLAACAFGDGRQQELIGELRQAFPVLTNRAW
ncbi:hypothetical protein [Kribbella pittospori]|uniref:hypothetical protein n=1 Tax=Kribbella pittospori TaxID=722689 RepID=UPI00192D58E3|nr:hypothetical protein [Kribbella pittospori]